MVDDERQIRLVLKTALASRGYAVRTAEDGDEALHTFQDWAPGLVITDLRMPNMGGLELCRSIRSRSAVPVIVLSVRSEEHDKVEALDAGADDYITKPFSIEELLARVRAIFRRANREQEQETKLIEIGDFHIDLEKHRVEVRNRQIALTPKEYELLLCLARNPGSLVTHRKLLGAVWDENDGEQIDSLRVFVGHLRRKLESEPSAPRYILTEHGIGYRFQPNGDIDYSRLGTRKNAAG
ncbi:MAG: response regulator transcription factor [Candidatus Korobacteraceae bacterium]